MIIDGHAHASGEFYDLTKILAQLDRLNVDKVVLCPSPQNREQGYYLPNISRIFPRSDVMLPINKAIRMIVGDPSAEQLAAGNEFIYSLQEKCPERIIQFYWADPREDNCLIDLADKHARWGFKGIKLHQCLTKFQIDSPGLHYVAEFAREKALPVFIHLYSRKDAAQLISLLRKYPETNFIIGHLIGLEQFIMEGRALPNIYFDISPATFTSSHRICKAIAAFGAEKLILGSDTPFGTANLLNNIIKIRRLCLTDHQKELVLGLNLQGLLNC